MFAAPNKAQVDRLQKHNGGPLVVVSQTEKENKVSRRVGGVRSNFLQQVALANFDFNFCIYIVRHGKIYFYGGVVTVLKPESVDG